MAIIGTEIAVVEGTACYFNGVSQSNGYLEMGARLISTIRYSLLTKSKLLKKIIIQMNLMSY
jgi:hypothetical protein